MKLLFSLLSALALVGTASAQDWAKAKLDQSPRHQEWVKLKRADREVDCFIVYPEVSAKATTVILVHEIFGLTDWARNVADEFAAAGYIAIIPDLLSGMGPNGGNFSAFPSQDDVIKAVSELPPEQVTGDLNAVVDYAAKIPAANGKIAVAGFCWGGGQAFRFATNNHHLQATFAFYGTSPTDESAIARIGCPVYGFYGGNDARVTATVPQTTDLMKQAGKIYEPVIYQGAGHGFMRAGEAPNAKPADQQARVAAWQRLKELLKKM